jgi:hypothetical protein
LELADVEDFVRRQFTNWAQKGRIENSQWRALDEYYVNRQREMTRAVKERQSAPAGILMPRDRCWSCKEQVTDGPGSNCGECGAPLDSPGVRSLRFLTFLAQEIRDHEEYSRLPLMQTHDLLAETGERLAALRRRLEKERLLEATPYSLQDEVPFAIPVARLAPKSKRSPIPAKKRPAKPQRTLWEILLDPRMVQWLLGFGGALLVVGLIIWLATLGVFENRVFVAAGLGIANAAMLAGGWATIRYTRFQTAGRALTLLACLVMPLNLWFYDRNNLITLSEGGHLWVAALVCCVLYAASALVLRDPIFVYVLVGGVAMTGLLILADKNVDQFFQIAAPSTMLVILGLASLHAERAFPVTEGPFSRRRFGKAFFWSGQALLGAGLLLLLGAQLFGWFHPVFSRIWNLEGLENLRNPPAVVTDHPLKVLALMLVLAGTYAYFYSDIVVRRVGIYVYFAIFTLLWAEVLAINVLELRIAMELVIAALSLTALAANLIQFKLTQHKEMFARTGPPLGLFLATVPVMLGMVLHLRATNADLNKMWPYEVSLGYVGAMLATAISCRIGAYLYRHTMARLSATYFFGTAAATIVAIAGLLAMINVRSWAVQAPILMLVPIAYLFPTGSTAGIRRKDRWFGLPTLPVA